MDNKTASAIMLTLLLTSMLTMASCIQSSRASVTEIVNPQSSFDTYLIDTFADGSREKNLTFIGKSLRSGNQIEWIKLPKAGTVLSASLNVTGYTLGTKIGEVYRDVGSYDYGLAFPSPMPYIRYIGDSKILVSSVTIEGVTNPGTLYAYVSTDPSCSSGTVKFSACYPFERSPFYTPPWPVTVSTALPLVKNDYLVVTWTGFLNIDADPLITVNDTWTSPSESFPIFDIYANQSTINNPYLDVGNSYRPWEWSYTGEFNESISSQVADLNTSLLNDYLRSVPSDPEGNISIPILFHSDSAGVLRISNIEIAYLYTVPISPPPPHLPTNDGLLVACTGALQLYKLSDWSMIWNREASLSGLKTGDVNNDGIDEILYQSDNLLYALDKNQNVLWTAYDFAPNMNPYAGIDVGDANGDGHMEVVAGGYRGGILVNGTDGSTIWSLWPSGNRVISMKIADVNNDGQAEIILGCDLGSEDNSLTAYNYTKGQLWACAPGSDGFGIDNIQVSDVNNDGKNEVIVAMTYSFGVFNGSDGALLWSRGSTGHVSFILGDVNGDGIDELIVCDDSGLYVYDGWGNRLWMNNRIGKVYSVAIGDVNGDHRNEVIVGADNLYVFDSFGNEIGYFATFEQVDCVVVYDPLIVFTSNDWNGYVWFFGNLTASEIFALPNDIFGMRIVKNAFAPVQTYAITITSTIGGTTSPVPGTYTYNNGTNVQVTANPSTNYTLDHWELDGSNAGSANPYAVTIDQNHTLKAVFVYSPPLPPPLSVSISPLSASTYFGQSIAFTSTVTGGTSPYSYQWYLNGTPVSGAISASWMFTPTSTGSYIIYLNVTDVLGATAKSNEASVIVAPSLAISISPLSISIFVGQSVTFSSAVNGGYKPYNYQWYLNGASVSGATSASWTFAQTTAGICYVYLKVTDAKGSTAQSETARTVVAAVPVGGYSIQIQVPAKTEPVLPYIALIATLTAIFTKLRPKTKRKR